MKKQNKKDMKHVKINKGNKSLISDIIGIIIILFPITVFFNSDIFIPIASAALLTAFMFRSSEKGYTDISLFMLAPFSLFLFSAVTLPLAGNKSAHIYYMISLIAIISVSSLTADYINVNTITEAKKKIINMISISVLLLGALQIVGIAFNMVFHANQPVKSSFGAFFAALSLVLQMRSSSEHKKRDGRIFFFMAVAITVFLINCSITSLIAACALFAVFVFYAKKRPPAFTALTVILSALLMFLFQNKWIIEAAFSAVKTHPLGMGGSGFLSAISLYMPESTGDAWQVGTFLYLITSSGIIGFAVNAFVLLWLLVLYIRTESFTSALTLVCTVFFMADGVSFPEACLWTIIMTFSDSDVRMTDTVKINEKRKTEFVCGVGVLTVMMVILSLLICMRIYGENLYRQKRYNSAELILKTVGTVNVTDSESLRILALTISDRNPKDWKEASEILDRAQKRDRDNSEIKAAQALVLYNGKQYKDSAGTWESAISMAPFNNDYKISYANVLYKWIQHEEYGSGESKRIHGIISSLAETVQDLDTKKIINDFSDKALEYTREKTLMNGEVIYEGSSTKG